jgi:hypothetical protein
MSAEFGLEYLNGTNTQVVESLYGAGFVEASRYDALDPKAVVEANHALAEFLYGSEVARLVRERDAGRLNEIHAANLEELLAPEALLDEVNLDSLGAILVRPEIAQSVEQCIDLVDRNGLMVAYDKPVQVDFTGYWNLYHHGLVDPESYSDFPTRTLNYIHKPCHLIVVARCGMMNSGLSVSDMLTRDLKGRQGTFSAGTLRGDIAFRALSRFVQDDNQSFTTKANTALDPIGAYRHLVRGNIPSDCAHETADSPLLFYAGQGVHIPNSTEISRDLRVLCTQQELEVMIVDGILPAKKDGRV